MGKERDAHGGNGDIYFSDDNLTATKILRNNSSTEKINRFKREVEVMQTLAERKISNIVEVISVELDEAHPAKSKIIMKKYEGCLTQLVNTTKGNVEYTLRLLLPIIKALKTLSEKDPAIYHRDLKPDNILYMSNEHGYELFLTDFGICFLKDDENRLTEEITAVGARMFLAPEYEIGRVENVTEKGDIFSIGKIIWWMINGIEKALLPSNFWFVDDFDLTKKFPEDPSIIAVNVIISSCLKINPNERCTYNQLISMIDNILSKKTISADEEKQYLVEVAMEKRKIEFAERLKCNKQLVNVFSKNLITALEIITEKYPSIAFLKTLKDQYVKKSKDGINYASVHVDKDSSHHLYTESFDNIYTHIDFNPARKGKKYANITFDYSIRSTNSREHMMIEYNEQGVIVSNYKSSIKELGVEVIILFLEEMISNYIA